MEKIIKKRKACNKVYKSSKDSGLSDLLSRIVANRVSISDINNNISFSGVLKPHVSHLPSPGLLLNIDKAINRLSDAIINKQKIGILTDYDVDGITSHAIISTALKQYFKVPDANISHYIGHRLKDGYGVSSGLVDKILLEDKNNLPDVIITADCGSSDEANISRLKDHGIDVIVTDHHAIPLEGVPKSAFCTVNPTQKECKYPSKVIAGCMVSWLVMCSLRNNLVSKNILSSGSPKLGGLLDFAALGTVADAVSLACPVNRAVVRSGLSIINKCNRPCWRAMKRILNRSNNELFEVDDLGFQIGPRINARSRMTEPFAALRYLLAKDDDISYKELEDLNTNNQDRKDTEQKMLIKAHEEAKGQIAEGAKALVVFDEDFHMGVQGIVASRLVDRYGRPAIVLSPIKDMDHKYSGSARTISSIHIRDALEQVYILNPELLLSFGGHQGAAGLKIPKDKFAEFKKVFNQVISNMVDSINIELKPEVFSDGELAADELSFDTVNNLKQLAPYGRGFEAPAFEGEFKVINFKWIGEDKTHVSMLLEKDNKRIKAVWFQVRTKSEAINQQNMFDPGDFVKCVYQLSEQSWQGERYLQMVLLWVEGV